ncbi:MAG: SPFH domain-containing protein [Lachnospiraceae bacterium]
MAKFVIECPKCHCYVEANTGIFAKKTIKCVCDNKIIINASKMASRTCSHCGNNVLFDQSKGEKAQCPVCRELINTITENDTKLEFSCGQCGVRLREKKGKPKCECPVCGYINDVKEREMVEKITHDGLASVIKYEGDNKTLVWKHPIEDFNMGSQLIVHESQEAIFFRDGKALDLFEAGEYTLETQQLPILEKLYKLPTDTEGTFHSEVYFINKTTHMGIKWGTDSLIRIFDPGSGMSVELGASGEFSIRVVNSRKLLVKLVGTTDELGQNQIIGTGNGLFRSMIMTQVKSFLANTIKEKGISVLEVDEHLVELGEGLREKINPRFAEYGLEVPEFFVSRVVRPDKDGNIGRMTEQYAKQYLGVKEQEILKNIAEAEGKVQIVRAQTDFDKSVIEARRDAETLKIKRQAEAEAYRMQVTAEAEEMSMKGFNYKEQTFRQIGTEAMKNGIAGNGGGTGGQGDIISTAVTLGTMGSIVNMTKDAINPVIDTAHQVGKEFGGIVYGGWDCSQCGTKNIQSRFCPECGIKKPEIKAGWDCPQCGTKNIQSRFCPECGTKKPETAEFWDCIECGKKYIMSKFCPECGAKKPEVKMTWDCPRCGNKGVSAKFCPECGCKKEE